MLYYSYGSALITEDEVHELDAKRKVDKLVDEVSSKSAMTAKSISLLNGVLTADMISSSMSALSAQIPWTPIGVGKPLTLDIREVYTGGYPGKGFFSGPKSMLLTSAVKSITAYDAKPRAINFLTRQVQTGSRLTRPAASEEGTPVLYYSPALTERSLTLDLAIVFDEFPSQIFTAVGNAFKSAAGLPVFLSQSMYLLAAGEVARIAGDAGEALFDGKPVLEASVSINVLLPGTVPAISGFMLVTPPNIDQLDPNFRTNHHIEDGSLVDQNGAAYTGQIPYIIMSVDGTSRPDLEGFAPTAASSAIMSRFYGIKDGQSVSLNPLVDALKLYNDFNFRSEADKLNVRLSSMPDGPDKDTLKQKRDALLKNIMTDIMRPAA